jgi:hypothetical protein
VIRPPAQDGGATPPPAPPRCGADRAQRRAARRRRRQGHPDPALRPVQACGAAGPRGRAGRRRLGLWGCRAAAAGRAAPRAHSVLRLQHSTAALRRRWKSAAAGGHDPLLVSETRPPPLRPPLRPCRHGGLGPLPAAMLLSGAAGGQRGGPQAARCCWAPAAPWPTGTPCCCRRCCWQRGGRTMGCTAGVLTGAGPGTAARAARQQLAALAQCAPKPPAALYVPPVDSATGGG